nr:NADPH-dependent FMN reductase [Neobacillus sp. Marseille-Q6967]
MKIVALVGSIREESINLNLVKTLQERYKGKLDIEIANIAKLPFYNQDDENNPNEEVKSFKNQILNSDGVLIATPEYNWSVPGVLKNALDWLSRVDFLLKNKPILIVGASPGQVGTLRAQLHLRQILSSPGISARVLPPSGNEVLVNNSLTKFKDGRLTDEATLKFIDEVTDRFIDWSKKE